MIINAINVGPNFETFGINFAPIDMSENSALSVKIKSENNPPPVFRIDLRDGKDRGTNAFPASLKLDNSINYIEYIFDFTNRFVQIWPNKSNVNSKKISGMTFFINPQSEPFTGKIIIDKIQRLKGEPINKKNIISEKSSKTNGVFVGCFMDVPSTLMGDAFAIKTGFKPASVMWYMDWNSEINTKEIQNIVDDGYTPHITWEAWKWDKSETINFKTILAGNHDNYIRKFATELKKVNGTIFIRLFHEFDGNWYPWSLSDNNYNFENFISSWRHIHNIFTDSGTNNIQWIWCMNSNSVPHNYKNNPILCYPGNNYVDWVSIDGYNWGTSGAGNFGWESFSEIFTNSYQLISENFPDKPIMLGEFGSTELGGNKSNWFFEMKNALEHNFPNIKSIVYFDVLKETDWAINSSKKSLNAFQKIMEDSLFRSSNIGLENVIKDYKQINPKQNLSISLNNQIEKKKASIYKTQNNIQIDGILLKDEWTNEPIIIEKSEIFIQYDEKYFYIAGNIFDSTPMQNYKNDNEIWNGDALEFTISTDPKSNPKRKYYTETDYQIGIKANKEGFIWNWTKSSQMINGNVEILKSENGYVIEAKLPLSEIGNLSFIPNSELGFEIAIDQGDSSKKRNSQHFWNSTQSGFHENPSFWGILQVKL